MSNLLNMKCRFILCSTTSFAAAALYGQAALAQAAAGPTVQLDTITVEGQADTATGPVNGYVATRSSTGSKDNTPITAIPRARGA